MSKKRGQGEGSIYKDRDGRWRGSVNLGYHAGKRVRRLVSGGTRTAVADKLKELLRNQQIGLAIRPDRQTVGQFLDDWLEQSIKHCVRPKSYVFYESIVRLHLKPEIGRLKLQKLSPQQVQRLLNAKLESGLAPRMVRHIRTTLITALEMPLKFGIISRNVAKLVDPRRVPRRELHPFTVQEARRFLEIVSGDRLEGVFVLSLSLGLRLGETLGLRWDDVELEQGRLKIRHSLERVAGQPFRLVETKSDYGVRTLALPAVASALVHRQTSTQQQAEELAGSRWKGNPWNLVFTSTVGTPLFQRNVHRHFWNLLDTGRSPAHPSSRHATQRRGLVDRAGSAPKGDSRVAWARLGGVHAAGLRTPV